ncbi:MAG: HD-GYP domain-containing protein [bacterium]
MRPRRLLLGSTAARVCLLLVGVGLVGAAARYLGFPPSHVLVITAIGLVFSLAATELPWGGYLLPSDALVLAVALLAARIEVAAFGLGAALAGAGVVAGWRRAALVASARNLASSVVTVVVWQAMAPSDLLPTMGGASVAAGPYAQWMASARSIPALAVACLVFFAVGSAVEIAMRSPSGFNLRQFWFFNFGRNFHHLIFTLLVGVTVAVAYLDLGMLAFVLFAFPLLLTRDALKRSLDLRESRLEALRALSSSVDARDRYTYDHSNRVSRLSALIAREMGFSESAVETIESGALLHDIGKLGVDVEILAKPGPLDREERAAIEVHPVKSAEVVSRVELFKGAVDVVKHHHERPDGAGYPGGLKAHEIPVGARILNVADAFDAMTSDRPYRGRRSVADALDELKKGSGSEFDPVVVEYLVKLLKKRTDEVADLSAR